jgi:hypothetical protein
VEWVISINSHEGRILNIYPEFKIINSTIPVAVLSCHFSKNSILYFIYSDLN